MILNTISKAVGFRQDKTRQDKTRQDKTRQDKTRQDKTRQDKTRQDKTRQDKTRQDKTRQLYYFFDIFVYDTVMPDLAPHVAERQEQ